jgi:HPt (histidine-containing phosphotransfer) domain-containing protein
LNANSRLTAAVIVSNLPSRERERPNPVNYQVLVLAEIFDRLREAMASDPQGFCELYREYLSDAWQSLAALREACQRGALAEFSNKAHYLKSSSLVLGIPPVANRCAELEQIGRMSDVHAASRKIEETGEVLSLVQAELQAKLGPQVVPSVA